MNKAVIHSDVHGRDTWKELVKLFPVEEYYHIFVGDYVDAFDKNDGQIIGNIREIIEFKRDNPDKVYLLLGNHDVAYYFYPDPNFRCSGFRPDVANLIHHIFMTNKDMFDFGLQLDDIYVTHAGICQEWFDMFHDCMIHYHIDVTIDNVIDTVNMCLHENASYEAIEIICRVGRARGGRYGKGGIVWADKAELQGDYYKGISQIVGHTHLNQKFRFMLENDKYLLFTDIAEKQIDHEVIVNDLETKLVLGDPTIVEFENIKR